jgi:hypothetical protein
MAMVELPRLLLTGDHKSLLDEFSQSGLQPPNKELHPTCLGCDAGAAGGVLAGLSCGCATVELLPVWCDPRPRPYLVSLPTRVGVVHRLLWPFLLPGTSSSRTPLAGLSGCSLAADHGFPCLAARPPVIACMCPPRSEMLSIGDECVD